MPPSITTDRDYLEIVDSNDLFLTATSAQSDADGQYPHTVMVGDSTVGTSVPINHNIGSIPIVRVFYDPDKNGTLYNTARFTTGDYTAEVSGPRVFHVSTAATTKILMNAPSSISNVPVYYRIYKFGDKGVSTDYAIDNIFAKGTDSETLGAAADSTLPVMSVNTIAHGLGEQILWKLQFSESPTGPWYDEGNLLFGAPDTTSGPPGGPYERYFYKTAYGYANATNFYISYLHNYGSGQTIYTRFVWEYKKIRCLFSTDLDAYRSSGIIQTSSLVFSGSVAAGGEKVVSATFDLVNQDFHQIMFDNSVYSPGKFRDIATEWGTYIHESTRDSELTINFDSKISGNTLTIQGKIFNLYDESVTLDSTTVGLRFVPYDSTLL